MKALIEDEYRQTLKSLGVVENFVRMQRRQWRARRDVRRRGKLQGLPPQHV